MYIWIPRGNKAWNYELKKGLIFRKQIATKKASLPNKRKIILPNAWYIKKRCFVCFMAAHKKPVKLYNKNISSGARTLSKV